MPIATKFNHRSRSERLGFKQPAKADTSKLPNENRDALSFAPQWTPGLDPDFDGLGMWTAHSFNIAPGLDALFGEDFATPSLRRSDDDRHAA